MGLRSNSEEHMVLVLKNEERVYVYINVYKMIQMK